jgi:hypothetical protein
MCFIVSSGDATMTRPAPFRIADAYAVHPTLLRRQSPGSFVREFKFTLEPYVGCAFGCRYCFVPAKSALGSLPGLEAWGSWYDALDPSQIDAELEAHADEIRDAWLYLAGETDAWQPIERTARATRFVLERLSALTFGRLLVSTRSPLILRDTDLLSDFAARTCIGISIPTDRDDVRKTVEPTAPSIERRIEIIRQLCAVGLNVRVNVAPLLPHSRDFAARLFDVAPRVWIDVPDPATPSWQAICRTIGWDAERTAPVYQEFYEQACTRFGGDGVGIGRRDFVKGLRATPLVGSEPST